MKKIKIALAGQPNVGKSMLINSIGNARLKVGNFSGVTVKKAVVSFQYKETQIEVVDLPGSYSLNDFTSEERVTKDFLDNEEYDLILNVVDSGNLERNLYLTTELLALNKNMVIALNMTDEAEAEGIEIDARQMSKLIGVPCVKTSAVTKKGIEELLEQLLLVGQAEQKSENRLQFSSTFEEEINHIQSCLEQKKYPLDTETSNPKSAYRALAIKLLREDKTIFQRITQEPIWVELQPILNKAFEHLYLHYDSHDLADVFNDEKIAFSRGAVTETVKYKQSPGKSLSNRLDSLLMHNILGLPIFLFLMWGLFQLTFEIGSIPMDWIDAFFASLIDGVKSFLGEGELGAVIGDGALAGVGAVVLFLPNIIILFMGIALLETTGYMSRVAFLLDGFFHKFGLHGKSFIPLVTGFGCSVPAYMSARTLKNDRDRLLTLFIIGFMSCGARLPIYVLFVGAFFSEQQAGNMLFLIYIVGALFGIIAAKVLKITVFKGEDEPFVMEMPRYRLPSLRLIWHTVSGQAMMYLKKAGTYILMASVLIWFASNYPKYPEVEAQYQAQIEIAADEAEVQRLSNKLTLYNLENSYLGKIGKLSEPLFEPLGYDWRMAVALETGLAAKEIVVSTLGILYGLGEEHTEESRGLMEKIQANVNLPVAISFIVFVMIYLPCLAASMVFMQEAGGWKYLGYLFVFTSLTAWGMAFIAFNLATVFTS